MAIPEELRKISILKNFTPGELFEDEVSSRELIDEVIRRVPTDEYNKEFVDLFGLDRQEILVVTGPTRGDHIGFYLGIITGYYPREDQLQIYYRDFDGSSAGEVKVGIEEGVSYRFGTVKRQK